MTGRPPLADYHGTVTGYRNRGCKCDACRAAHCRTVKRWRHQSRADSNGVPTHRTTVDAGPVRAHIEELHASGWTFAQMAAETGVSQAAFARIARGERRRVRIATAIAVRNLDPLPSLDGYVDPVVVDRLTAAYPDPIWRSIGATRAERITAAEQLLDTVRRIRRPQRAAGIAEQWADGPTITGIEDALGLRQSRDFGRPTQQVGETA